MPMLPIPLALALLVLDPARQSVAAPADSTWTQAALEEMAREVQGQIAALRKQEFLRPVRVELADEEAVLAYLRRRMDATQSAGRMRRDETVARLLRLVPPRMDLQAELEELLKSQVGGFYDPGSDTFYLMQSFRGDLARLIMAHELTHALDDQHYDIDATVELAEEETDREFAVQAVAEGSATNLMNRWLRQHLRDLDLGSIAEFTEMTQRGLDRAPALLWKPMLAAYLRGEGFLVRSASLNLLQVAAKDADVEAAFRKPPRSSEQILHPEKYWKDAQRDDPRRVDLDLAATGAGWSPLGMDVLGEIVLAIVLSDPAETLAIDAADPRAMLQLAYTNPRAEGWGGDRAVVLERDGTQYLGLVTLWDTDADAEEFAAALRALLDAEFGGGDRPPSEWAGWASAARLTTRSGEAAWGRALAAAPGRARPGLAGGPAQRSDWVLLEVVRAEGGSAASAEPLALDLGAISWREAEAGAPR